jgi:hypothetical protein
VLIGKSNRARATWSRSFSPMRLATTAAAPIVDQSDGAVSVADGIQTTDLMRSVTRPTWCLCEGDLRQARMQTRSLMGATSASGD